MTPRILAAVDFDSMYHINEGRDYNNLADCRLLRVIGLIEVVDNCTPSGQNNCNETTTPGRPRLISPYQTRDTKNQSHNTSQPNHSPNINKPSLNHGIII